MKGKIGEHMRNADYFEIMNLIKGIALTFILLGICIFPVASDQQEERVSSIYLDMPFETFMQVPFGTDFQLFALETNYDICPPDIELMNHPEVIQVSLGFLQVTPGAWCILVHTRSSGVFDSGDFSYLPLYNPDDL